MKIKHAVSPVAWAICAACAVLADPAPASLNIDTYAGLTITGEIGTVYSVEYVSDLAQTNDAGAWRCLEFLQLPASPYLWADKSSPVTGKRFYRAVAFPAPTNMVFIPPGTFRMGSPTNEVGYWYVEGPQTDVIISRGNWMGKFEVTQGEYLAVMGNNPSHHIGGSDLPVEMVSWDDAVAYCTKLTERERSAGRIGANWTYRLPTEAEWEYACRARTSTRFSYGDDPGYTNLTSYAWYEGNNGDITHPVGQKLPNPWGLYDMHGNVMEWCKDWLGDYPGGTVLDPEGLAADPNRAIRTGFSIGTPFGPKSCRSAYRVWFPREGSGSMLGFRVVLVPGQP